MMKNRNELNEMFAALRHTEPYFPDDGFTAGVLARLPDTQELSPWLKNLILLGFTALGSALAAWQLPVTKLVSFTTTNLLSLPLLGTAAIGIFIFSYIAIWLVQTESI